MAEDTKKWSCPRCTYDNWPLSPHCTICNARRSPFPAEHEDSSYIIEPTNSKLASGGWTCSMCTFDNWAASGRCTQCGSPSPLAASSKPHSPPSTTSVSNNKWTCPTCTYQNWPKSKHCVMCRASQPPSTQLPSPSFSFIHTSFDDDWLSACRSVITGDTDSLQTLLIRSESQSPLSSRQLTTQECEVLEQYNTTANITLRPGLSLLDLIRLYNRTDCISYLTTLPSPVSKSRAKRPICGVNSVAAKELLRRLNSCIRQRKGVFSCYYLTEFGTFYLPAEVRDLSIDVQKVLRKDICDMEVLHGRFFDVTFGRNFLYLLF